MFYLEYASAQWPVSIDRICIMQESAECEDIKARAAGLTFINPGLIRLKVEIAQTLICD